MMSTLHTSGALALLLIGCEPAATSSIAAHFSVIDTETALSLRADFVVDDSSANLGDDARVTATFQGNEITVEPTPFGYFTRVEVPTPIADAEPFTFGLFRDGEPDAPASTITALGLVVDAVPLFLSRSSDVVVSWSPASETSIDWLVDGVCAFGHGTIAPGATTLTIAASSLETRDPFTSTCTAELSLTRRREAPVDPAFASGEITYTRTFKTEFASTP
jgi:hypothetical protein